jgi:hypothetical protein
MSIFSNSLRNAFRGAPSFESAIVETPEPQVPADEITEELIIQTQDERAELSDALDEVHELGEDQRDLDTATAVVHNVAAAVNAAEDVPAHAAEAFAEIANVTIADAEKILDTELPRLETGSDGAVTEASMESFGDWFRGAVKSFGSAMGSFVERMALSFSRLNDSSKGLVKRSMRVRSVIGKRKGEGGKPLKLNSGVLKHLILGDNYTKDPVGALKEFADTNLAITKVVEQYHHRLAEIIKTRIFDALSKSSNNNVLINIPTEDLLKELKKILDHQPKNFLGNQVYAIQENRYNVILQAVLSSTATEAGMLIKHLDAPVSLTNDEVGKILAGLEGIITDQVKTLERITDSTTSTFKSVRSVIQQLNKSAEDDKDDGVDLPDNVNYLDLLRIENDMVAELGRVCDRLNRYQSDLVDRIDSVLTYVEESVFQD